MFSHNAERTEGPARAGCSSRREEPSGWFLPAEFEAWARLTEQSPGRVLCSTEPKEIKPDCNKNRQRPNHVERETISMPPTFSPMRKPYLLMHALRHTFCNVAYMVSVWLQAHHLPSLAPSPEVPKHHQIPRSVGCAERDEDMAQSLPKAGGGPCYSSWAHSPPHTGRLEGYTESARPWSGRNTCGRTTDHRSGSFYSSK